MASYTLTLQQIINGGHKIFDFDYNFYDESMKPIFEQLFIDHFYLEEIGHETVSLFKHRLKTKLNLILPYYNKLYYSQQLEQRILDNYDVTEEITRIVNGDITRHIQGNTNNKNVRKNLYKDAPKTKIDVNRFDVVTNLSKDEHEGTTNNNTTEKGNSNNTEKYTRRMTGNIGVQTDADAIIKYWNSIRNITLEIFDNELSSLFMGVF